MGYKWDMLWGGDKVKEMKIRIEGALHRDLKKVAHKSLRSVTKQVVIYIQKGLSEDREDRTRKAGGSV